ncbi:MAG: lipopolysaccharide biosynthesis [Bryobacterales bacterium]|nr:lipopolysaccharide biosynthesis [Bryobacterales bacterium]
MKRLTRVLISLYPRAWRDRYEAECAALVEDTGGGWTNLLDTVAAALRMRCVSGTSRLAGACVLAGFAIASILALQKPIRYVSSAAVQIEPGSGADPGIMADMRDTTVHALLRNRSGLARSIGISEAQVDDRIEAGDLRISSLRATSSIVISWSGDDPASAQAATQKLLTRVFDENQWTQQRLSHAAHGLRADPAHIRQFGGGSQIKVAKVPSLPAHGDYSRHWAIMGLGPLGGLLVGLAILGIRRAPRVSLACSLLLGFGAAVLWSPGLILPVPYTSTAEIDFDSPETMHDLAGNSDILADGLLASVQASGDTWFRLQVDPLSPTRLRVSVRYSNPYKADVMLSRVTTKINQIALETRKANGGPYEAPIGPWVYLVAGQPEPAFPGNVLARSILLCASICIALTACSFLLTNGNHHGFKVQAA